MRVVEPLVLVLTDVEGSTRLWQDEPVAMDAAMRRHHAIVHGAVAAHGGWRPPDQGEGDAVFAAFRSATAALDAVAQVQRELAAEPWTTSVPLKVRIGVHLGEVAERGGNLFGDPVNRCARLRGLASGGQTLLSAPVYEVVRDRLPAGVSVSDLGEHRMKDLTRPERVHQLDIAGLDTAFPPLSSLDRATHNLPVQAAPFIGREAELASLVAAVRAHRLVTLIGFGGMGKTRLALQAAAELTGDPDVGDVWFVDLATVTDPALVPARVAEAAGVRFGAGDPAQALIAAFAERPTLLVLDNLEQVLGCAAFVSDLVAASPAVRVLATSREPLRVRAERQVPLAPMSLPTGSSTAPLSAQSLSTYEAVRFFVDRACAVRPDFAITNETAPAVAAICARLDGHPLALELAAARVKMLSVDKLLTRLDSALAVLTGGSRDMPERHQTLRATISWSYDACNPAEQLLLARLSVLPAPADLDMVEAVCGDGLEVYDVLEALVERSLVRTSEVDGDTRFGLLVSVRDFAGEHVDPRKVRVLRDRHAAHVTGVFTAPRDPWASIDLTRRELTHLRAALVHLQATDADEQYIHLAAAVDDGLHHNGHLAEYAVVATHALTLGGTPRQRARLFAVLAMTHSALGQVAMELEALHEGLTEARRCDDPDVHANVVVMALGTARTRAELYELIAEYRGLRDLLPPDVREQYDEEEANMVALLLRLFDPPAAEEAARRFCGGAREAVHCVRLAQILLDTGRIDEACEVLARVQDPAVFRGMRSWEFYGLTVRARAGLLQGDLHGARVLAEEARHGLLALGARPWGAAVVLAQIERRESQPRAAVAVFDHALIGAPEPPDALVAQLLWRRAIAHLDCGRADLALEDVTAARKVLQDEELYLLDLLGCLVAEALVLEATDPGRSARLLGAVQAHRGSWLLPFDLDDDAARLTGRLGGDHGAEIERGRVLAPAAAAAGP